MIAIRAAEPGDAAAIAAIYAPHATAGTATFELDPPDAAEMGRRMAASQGYYPWLVATEGAAVLGYAYAGTFRERTAYRLAVETTVYVADRAAGQGIGRQLYDVLIATLIAQGFTQAFGVIALPNPASVALHEAAGFEHVGTWRDAGFKLDQWIDVGIWQRSLGPSQVPPIEPRPFAEVGVVRR